MLVELVRRAQQCELERLALPAFGARKQQRDVIVRHPEPPADAHVCGVLVFRSAQDADPNQQHLAMARRQRRVAVDMHVYRAAHTVSRRITHERAEHVGAAPAAVLGLDRRNARLTADEAKMRALRRRLVGDVRRQGIVGARLELDAKRVDDARIHRQPADGIDRVDHLIDVVARRKRLPGCIGDDRVDVKLIRGEEQRGFEVVPAGVGAARDALDLGVAEAIFACNRHAVRPEIARAGQPCRAQPEERPMPGGQRRLRPKIVQMPQHRLPELRVMRIRADGVRNIGLEIRRGLTQRVRPLGFGHGIDTRRLGRARLGDGRARDQKHRSRTDGGPHYMVHSCAPVPRRRATASLAKLRA